MGSVQEAEQLARSLVRMYYHLIERQPDRVHECYNFRSKMVRIDGDSVTQVHTYMDIHSIIMSLGFRRIELKTIKCVDVWDGGFVTVVRGSVEPRGFHGRREFGQSLFFASVIGNHHIRNDIFMFIGEVPGPPIPATLTPGLRIDNNPDASGSRHVAPGSSSVPGFGRASTTPES